MTNSPNKARDDRSDLLRRAEEVLQRSQSPEIAEGIRAFVQRTYASQPSKVGSQESATSKAERTEDSAGIDAYKTLTSSEYPDSHTTFETLGIIVGLLRNKVVCKAMKFDDNILIKLLQAVFSKATGKQMSDTDVYKLIRLQGPTSKGKIAPIPAAMVFFRHILKLQPDSAFEEVQSGVEAMNNAFQELELNLNQHRLLEDAKALLLATKSQKLDDAIAATEVELSEQEFKFSAAKLKTILESVGQTPEASDDEGDENESDGDSDGDGDSSDTDDERVDDEAQSEIDYAEFVAENPGPVLKLYNNLFTAFKQATTDPSAFLIESQVRLLDGDILTVVTEKIDQAFIDEVSEGLGAALCAAAANANDSSALIKRIAELYDLEFDLDGLKDKLIEIHERIARLYKELLAENDVLRQTIATGRPTVMAINYPDFYKDMWDKPEGYQAYLLNYLHGALRCDEATFNNKYRNEYFNGQDLSKVKTDLIDALGPELFSRLLVAARSQNFGIALIEAIADYYETGANVNTLKTKIKEVYDRVRTVCPGLLHANDPNKSIT